jgi:Beta-lactamase
VPCDPGASHLFILDGTPSRLAADGARVLSAESTQAMTRLEADLPDKYSLGDSWGIGWIRFGWDSRRLVGHDGDTIGQSAFLRVLPDAGLAVTLLTNGGHARDLYHDLYREIFAGLADVDMPAPIEPHAESIPADIRPHLGRYERAGALIEVLDGTLLRALAATATAPGSLSGIAFNRHHPDNHEVWELPNLPVIRPAGPASFGGVGTARALARLYSAAISPTDGAAPLLTPSTAAAFAQVQYAGWDLVLRQRKAWAVGFHPSSELYPSLGAGAFGHSGAGGQQALADPRNELSYAFLRRRFLYPRRPTPTTTASCEPCTPRSTQPASLRHSAPKASWRV